MRGGDVEEDQLVGALGVVALGQLDRIAGVAQADEVRALDDSPRVDVEAGDDALEDHRQSVGRWEIRVPSPEDRCAADRGGWFEQLALKPSGEGTRIS